MENIFNLSLKEIDKEFDKLLKNFTPEELLKELKECGYEQDEIMIIEKEVNDSVYVKDMQIKHENLYNEFLHKRRTRNLKTFDNIEVEVA